MTTWVTEIELNKPLPCLKLPAGTNGMLALLRRQGQPVGLLRLDKVSSPVTALQLKTALARQGLLPKTELENKTGPAKLAEPVSIIVCTHERPEDLERCLEGLLPFARAGHEVVIVDNAPKTARTAELVANYPFKYVCEPVKGLDRARNTGLKQATQVIVAFTDDDAVPDPDWINRLVQPFEKAEVGCVTGLVMPLELQTPAQELFEIYCRKRRNFTPETFSIPALKPAAAGVVGMGANMALRRKLALELGGFDPRLDGGTATCSGGDTDMFARILQSGATIVYTPAALVWHRHRLEIKELQNCIFGYGVGLYSFLTKRLVEQRDWHALVIGARWLVGPFVKALGQAVGGQPTVSPLLLFLEAGGACLGPIRFYQETIRYKAGNNNIPASVPDKAEISCGSGGESIYGDQSVIG